MPEAPSTIAVLKNCVGRNGLLFPHRCLTGQNRRDASICRAMRSVGIQNTPRSVQTHLADLFELAADMAEEMQAFADLIRHPMHEEAVMEYVRQFRDKPSVLLLAGVLATHTFDRLLLALVDGRDAYLAAHPGQDPSRHSELARAIDKFRAETRRFWPLLRQFLEWEIEQYDGDKAEEVNLWLVQEFEEEERVFQARIAAGEFPLHSSVIERQGRAAAASAAAAESMGTLAIADKDVEMKDQ